METQARQFRGWLSKRTTQKSQRGTPRHAHTCPWNPPREASLGVSERMNNAKKINAEHAEHAEPAHPSTRFATPSLSVPPVVVCTTVPVGDVRSLLIIASIAAALSRRLSGHRDRRCRRKHLEIPLRRAGCDGRAVGTQKKEGESGKCLTQDGNIRNVCTLTLRPIGP